VGDDASGTLQKPVAHLCNNCAIPDSTPGTRPLDRMPRLRPYLHRMAEHSAPALEIDPKYGPFDKHTPMMQRYLFVAA
jgi:DNA mismatch repair protein MutS